MTAVQDTGDASPRTLRGRDGQMYNLGLIDVLEEWRLRWRVQGWVLRTFFRYVACSQWRAARHRWTG